MQHGDSTDLQREVSPDSVPRHWDKSETVRVSRATCPPSSPKAPALPSPGIWLHTRFSIWLVHTFRTAAAFQFRSSASSEPNLYAEKKQLRFIFFKCFHPTLHQYLKAYFCRIPHMLKDLHKTPASKVANKNTWIRTKITVNTLGEKKLAECLYEASKFHLWSPLILKLLIITGLQKRDVYQPWKGMSNPILVECACAVPSLA